MTDRNRALTHLNQWVKCVLHIEKEIAMLEFTTGDENVQEVITSKVRDNVILNIVHLVNVEAVINVDLTLFCKGLVIAGDVISGKEYCSSMAASLDGKSAHLQKLYIDIGEKFYSQDEPPLNYIHLKNVVVKGADQNLTPFKNGLLRMRIDEIDAHMVGRPN